MMMTNEVQKRSEHRVTYTMNDEPISLTPSIVQQFITKGSTTITHEEAINFMMLCKYAKLNPFINEAYLIKYGSNPAQMVVSKEAFMKRANRQEQYNGLQAGIVVMSNNEVVHKEGQALYPNEQLIGGWARVYRKDIEYPIVVEVSVAEFSKTQSTWKTMPATMIRKVAVVNALREAFPEELGAMYTEDESINNTHEKQTVKQVQAAPKNDLAKEFEQHQQPVLEEKATSKKEVEVIEPEQVELDMVDANRSAYEKELEMKQVAEQQELL